MSRLGLIRCRECGSTEVEPDAGIALCESCYSEMYVTCEMCEGTTNMDDINEGLCPACHEEHYCECGNKLEDSYGSPGYGFCTVCR